VAEHLVGATPAIRTCRAHLGGSLGFPNVAFARSVIDQFVQEFVDDPGDDATMVG
jgi:hypothetical protein